MGTCVQWLGCFLCVAGFAWCQDRTDETHYRYGQASRDGIGKFYQGREISHVMGHRGVGWLERASRAQEEKPMAVIKAMNLAEDAVVADVGAGSGYFTFRMAAVVPNGQVWAVDIQPEMLARLRTRTAQKGMEHVVPHRGKIDDPQLPHNQFDAVLMVDAYHEFSHPFEMMQGLYQALKPGGRIYLVEYRGEDPRIPIKPLHKMTLAQARKEMALVGFEFVENRNFLPSQHFMVFMKPK